MRRAAIVGTIIASMLVFGLMLVPIVGASGSGAPVLQATGTAAATTAATTVATTAATAVATTAATIAPTTATGTGALTPTRAPGALPNTGGDDGAGTLLLGAAALLILGIAGATLVASRRSARL